MVQIVNPFSGGVVTLPTLFPDGSAAAPSVAGANYTNIGLYFAGSELNFAVDGTRRMGLSFNGLNMPSSSADICNSDQSNAEMLRLRGSGGIDVNEVTITAAATTAAPSIAATGNDTNIVLNLRGKGTATGGGVSIESATGLIGFYGTVPIVKQTGVAVTAGGIHAALVALGLIAA